MATVSLGLVEWGAATLALSGQCGDHHVVKPFPDGVLVAAIDGLGHGDEAAAAAKLAAGILETHPSESMLWLVRRCHESLRRTRGVVMSVASFNTVEGTMTWLGVGNVEGRLLRADPSANPHCEYLMLRGGVVGDQLPPFHASLIQVAPGDMLMFATDGIYGPFIDAVNVREPPQQNADRIIASRSKRTDDALVVVVRYLGNKKGDEGDAA